MIALRHPTGDAGTRQEARNFNFWRQTHSSEGEKKRREMETKAAAASRERLDESRSCAPSLSLSRRMKDDP